MHRALVIRDDAASVGDSLNVALTTCGFLVGEQNAWPDDDADGGWSIVARRDTRPDDSGASGRARYRLWFAHVADETVSGGTASAFMSLLEPVQLTDLVMLLLALGMTPLTADDLDGLSHRLDELASHDDAIVGELIGSLLITNEQDLDALRRALIRGDWRGVGSYAHRLKSSAKMLGCDGLVSVCETIEHDDGTGDIDTALALVAWAASALAALNARLREDIAF